MYATKEQVKTVVEKWCAGAGIKLVNIVDNGMLLDRPYYTIVIKSYGRMGASAVRNSLGNSLRYLGIQYAVTLGK